jgi:hypothetical protein
MASKGYFRGHPLVWINNKRVYKDNGKEIPANGGEIRPCAKCGALFPLGEGEVDPCLGVLPGVDNACCGHGIRSEAYVRFTNGVVLKEFIIDI